MLDENVDPLAGDLILNFKRIHCDYVFRKFRNAVKAPRSKNSQPSEVKTLVPLQAKQRKLKKTKKQFKYFFASQTSRDDCYLSLVERKIQVSFLNAKVTTIKPNVKLQFI